MVCRLLETQLAKDNFQPLFGMLKTIWQATSTQVVSAPCKIFRPFLQLLFGRTFMCGWQRLDLDFSCASIDVLFHCKDQKQVLSFIMVLVFSQSSKTKICVYAALCMPGYKRGCAECAEQSSLDHTGLVWPWPAICTVFFSAPKSASGGERTLPLGYCDGVILELGLVI